MRIYCQGILTACYRPNFGFHAGIWHCGRCHRPVRWAVWP